MNLTQSKDGVRRFTIHVAHRIGKDFLVAWLCHRIANQLYFKGPADSQTPDEILIDRETLCLLSNKAAVLEAIREDLKHRGAEYLIRWADEIESDDQGLIVTESTKQIEQLFPKLKSE